MMIGLIKKSHDISTILVILLILAAMEVFVRDDRFYELGPTSHAQGPIEISESGFELIENPRIIVLGNSLTRDAIAPFEMTRLASADKHFLLNLSQSAGVMTDQLWLYGLYRDNFRKADILVIGIDFRSFDDTANREPNNPSRFRRYASTAQRLSIDDRSDRISLLVGNIWKTWDGRQQINGYVRGLNRRAVQPKIDDLGRIDVRPGVTSTEVDDIIGYTAKDYTFFKGLQFEAFTELVRMAQHDSLNIVLLDAPASDIYLDQLSINIGDENQRLYAAIQRETGLGIIRIRLTEEDCNTLDSCFIDYGHMNASGSKIYSRKLLDRLFSQTGL